MNLDGKAVDVRWALYVNEDGDKIHFVGQTKLGLTEILQAPVVFTAGDWRMITLCYSETNSVLLLDNEVVAKGKGVVAPAPWEEKSLGLVVGSDVLASPESLAHAQFEELTTMRQWPSQSEWQALYFQSTKRRTLLGPLGTDDEELAKVAGLKTAGLLPEDYGLAKNSGGGDGPIMAYNYAEGDLWLEITGVTNPYSYLTLHGTVPADWYQLLSKTNLTQPGEWTLGEMRPGDYGTNQTDFSPVYVADDTNQFFRAQHAAGYIYIIAGAHAFEPNPVFNTGVGTFSIGATWNTNLTVYYRISGTASNGVDYTNLTSLVTVPAGATVNIPVHPLADSLLEAEETVTLTLVQTNNYVIDPAHAAATILIKDSSTLVQVGEWGDAFEAGGPPGAAAQTGAIYVYRYDEQLLYPPLTVPYSIAGSASNGTDYTTLSGTVTIPAGDYFAYLDINPVADSLVEGIETVTVTLIPTNTFLIDTNNASASVTITDSSTTVEVSPLVINATEPHPASNIAKQTGRFLINREDRRRELPALTVSYQLTGTASNGVDYTNLTATVTIPATESSAVIFIEPLFDGLFEGDETVTLTLTQIGDGYFIKPGFASATLTIMDNLATNTFQAVAQIYHPVGIDYHPPTDSLIVSTNANTGEPRNFCRLFKTLVGSNGVTVITNWSGVHGVPNEVKLVTVKTNGNGFTNGDLYYGSGTGIGWVSADATSSNLNWCILTNAVQTNAAYTWGSLCLDQTGVFSNQLIAVANPGNATGRKSVWRVAANRNPTLVAEIVTGHLGGVVVLTNDATKWGPWAGKIITGDENKTPPPIYTVAANGVVTTNDTTTLIAGGIRTEDLDLIPAGQDLYACDYYGNAVVKVSRDYFTNYVGQLLVTQEGSSLSDPARFFAVRWNAATTNFVTRHILNYSAPLEHVTFAPVNLPPVTP